MELRVVVAQGQDSVRLSGDRSPEPVAAPSSQGAIRDIGAEATRLGHVGRAQRSRVVRRISYSELSPSEPVAGCRPTLKKGGTIHALTVPVEQVDRGDVVAIGRRFYRVDSVVATPSRSEFPLIVIRSLETAALAAIEFRNLDALVSVLRLPTVPWWSRDLALAHHRGSS
jgi:hypothetical protein